MFKTLFRFSFVLFLLVLLAFGWFLGQYKIVRTDDGYHAIRNEKWGFSTAVVDTRDWNLGDYWKNSHISSELARIKFEKLKGQLSERWDDISQDIEAFSKKHDLDQTSAQARERMAWLKEETKKKYENLLEQMEKGDLNMAAFKKKVEQLGTWADNQVRQIKRELTS